MRLGKGLLSAIKRGGQSVGLSAVTLGATMGPPGVGAIIHFARNVELRKAGRGDNQKALTGIPSAIAKRRCPSVFAHPELVERCRFKLPMVRQAHHERLGKDSAIALAECQGDRRSTNRPPSPKQTINLGIAESREVCDEFFHLSLNRNVGHSLPWKLLRLLIANR